MQGIWPRATYTTGNVNWLNIRQDPSHRSCGWVSSSAKPCPEFPSPKLNVNNLVSIASSTFTDLNPNISNYILKFLRLNSGTFSVLQVRAVVWSQLRTTYKRGPQTADRVICPSGFRTHTIWHGAGAFLHCVQGTRHFINSPAHLLTDLHGR